MRRMRADRRAMGSPPDVSAMRGDSLLRQLAASSRQPTRPRGRASRHRLRPTRRTLALLLPRRGFLRILTALFPARISSTRRNMVDLVHVASGGGGGLRGTAAVLTRTHVGRV